MCYEMFFKKWIYYFEDMVEFIKLGDVKNIWPLIVLSNTGPRMLILDEDGAKAIQLI